MRPSRSATWVVAAVLLLLGPAAAFAQCISPNSISGILTETMENPPAQAPPLGPLLAGTFANGSRQAQATELGVLAHGCGSLVSLAGNITVQAGSNVPVTAFGLGVGSISGTFGVDTASGHVQGQLSGVLDFTPTNSNKADCSGKPCPWVYASGNWSAHGQSDQSGAFSGLALVPFLCPGFGPTGLCYLDPTGALFAVAGGMQVSVSPPLFLVALNPNTDFDRFGNPGAKFIITLYQ